MKTEHFDQVHRDNQGIEVVEINYAKLVDACEELEGKHLEYVNLLTDEHLVDKEEIWMTEVEEKYCNAFNRKVKYVENVTTSEGGGNARTRSLSRSH